MVPQFSAALLELQARSPGRCAARCSTTLPSARVSDDCARPSPTAPCVDSWPPCWMRSQIVACSSWLPAQLLPSAFCGCVHGALRECGVRWLSRNASPSRWRACTTQDSQAAVVKAALLSGTGVLRLTVVLACKQVCAGTLARPARCDSPAALGHRRPVAGDGGGVVSLEGAVR